MKVMTFNDRQQNLSQDFWKILNMSMLNAASENTIVVLCWHKQGHHEQKEVAMLKEVYGFIGWLADRSGKAADPSIIHFKIRQPFFMEAPPLTREPFPCFSACPVRVALGKLPPEKWAFFCLALAKKLQECFQKKFSWNSKSTFSKCLGFFKLSFLHPHTHKALHFLGCIVSIDRHEGLSQSSWLQNSLLKNLSTIVRKSLWLLCPIPSLMKRNQLHSFDHTFLFFASSR